MRIQAGRVLTTTFRPLPNPTLDPPFSSRPRFKTHSQTFAARRTSGSLLTTLSEVLRAPSVPLRTGSHGALPIQTYRDSGNRESARARWLPTNGGVWPSHIQLRPFCTGVKVRSKAAHEPEHFQNAGNWLTEGALIGSGIMGLTAQDKGRSHKTGIVSGRSVRPAFRIQRLHRSLHRSRAAPSSPESLPGKAEP
jgi:hypothetical protein